MNIHRYGFSQIHFFTYSKSFCLIIHRSMSLTVTLRRKLLALIVHRY